MLRGRYFNILDGLSKGGPPPYTPASDSDASYWTETGSYGLANNALVASYPNQSSLGTNTVSNAGMANQNTYKTAILNGFGVCANAANAWWTMGAQSSANGTFCLLKKGLSGSDTNDVSNFSAAATRIRLAAPGYDYYANSAVGIVAVGGTTLLSWDTIIMRWTGAAVVIRINGVQKALFTSHANLNSGGLLVFMSGLAGYFAAFGRWTTDIGDTRAAQVESYLRTKYAHY